MIMAVLMGYGPYVGFALALAIAVIASLAIGLHFEKRLGGVAIDLIPAMLISVIGIGALISGRNVSLYGLGNFALGAVSGTGGHWPIRITTAVVVGISVVVIISSLLRQSINRKGANFIFYSFAAYFLSMSVVSGIFGTTPAFSHNSMYSLLVVWAFYVTCDRPFPPFVQLTRDALFIFMVVSLAMLLIAPELVQQKGYPGEIPGLDFRFWGLASHANNMGPIAAFFLLLLYLRTYQSRFLVIAAIGVAVVSIVLAQSKTAWAASIVSLSVLVIRSLYISFFHALIKGQPRLFPVLIAFVFIAISLAGLFIVSGNYYVKPLGYANDVLNHFARTLTGRDVIWYITMQQFYDNPLFGYGPDLWGYEFSARYGYLGIASNAHNQVLEVLGSAGAFGLATFVVYFGILIRYAFILMPMTKGVSLALVVFLIVRGIAEVPLGLANITTTDFFMHLVVIGIFLRAAYALNASKTYQTSHSNSVQIADKLLV
jgi:O-antigen ligase